MSNQDQFATPEEEELWRSMDKPAKNLRGEWAFKNDSYAITASHGYDPMSKPPPQTKDNVNPSHYKSGSIECIDALRSCLTPEEFRGYCKGSAMAYIWRMGKKDDVRQEAEKAIWYETWLAGRDPRK